MEVKSESENLKERDNSEDLGVDEMIILNTCLKVGGCQGVDWIELA
jgi:hypothetical protein